MAAENVLPEDEQRKFQASYWGLPPTASWDLIREEASKQAKMPLFYHPDDWAKTMVRLYGPIFSD